MPIQSSSFYKTLLHTVHMIEQNVSYHVSKSFIPEIFFSGKGEGQKISCYGVAWYLKICRGERGTIFVIKGICVLLVYFNEM